MAENVKKPMRYSVKTKTGGALNGEFTVNVTPLTAILLLAVKLPVRSVPVGPFKMSLHFLTGMEQFTTTLKYLKKY